MRRIFISRIPRLKPPPVIPNGVHGVRNPSSFLSRTGIPRFARNDRVAYFSLQFCEGGVVKRSVVIFFRRRWMPAPRTFYLGAQFQYVLEALQIKHRVLRESARSGHE